ncbi:MAG: TetR family transcriptional regulator [Frondihabitans sp.]|nr:TetR family transcriptional regulator [Frondihabitans sp.]
MCNNADMANLWDGAVQAHQQSVRDATLDATAVLVAERGLASLTMSEIASGAGIGRATLYRYFPDVETILTAWHERTILEHLRRLSEVRDRESDPSRRLHAALTAYAEMAYQHEVTNLAASLHQAEHVAQAQRHLRNFVEDLIRDEVRAGTIRDDIPPTEAASYCLHALTAASGMRSRAAVGRLVTITLDALRLGGKLSQ